MYAASRAREALTHRPTHPPHSPYVTHYGVLVAHNIRLSEELGLANVTTFRTCGLMDRLFTSPVINTERAINKFQLGALVCTGISAKFEETPQNQPLVSELLQSADGQYTKEEYFDLERFALDHFQWDVNDVTAACFSSYFLQHSSLGSAVWDEQLQRLMVLLQGLTLQDYAFVQYPPSLLCAAELKVARAALRRSIGPGAPFAEWDAALETLTWYFAADLQDCGAAVQQKLTTFRQNTPVQALIDANLGFLV